MAAEFEADQVLDSEEIEIEARTLESDEDKFFVKELAKLAKGEDPFEKIPFDALDKNSKRRATRLIKRLEGIGGAKAKYLTYEQINGYMLYYLASPPYNLDYLTYLGTEDPTNHACIQLKTYSIVGQGFTWKETNKIKLKREDAQEKDEFQRQKAAVDFKQKVADHQVSQQQESMSADLENNTPNADGTPSRAKKMPNIEAPPIFDPTEYSFDAAMQFLTQKLARVQDSLNDKLDSFNNIESFLDTLTKAWMDVEATGNGYIEIGRTNKGDIGYVGHIPSATMRIRIPRDGYVQWVLPGYVGPSPFGLSGPYPGLTFFRNFGDTTTPDIFGKDPNPNEVIHIKKHSVKNNYYGVPDIVSAIGAVAGDKFAREYNLDYFENKAVPRYALIVKGAKLSAQAERKILDYFRKEIKGKHHGTLYIPIPASAGNKVDVELTPIENQMQEGSFHNYRMDNRVEIMMAHRVPPSKLGIPTHSGGGGGGMAGTREDAKTFKEQVCLPEQMRFEFYINKMIKELTDMFTFKFNEYDLMDEETRSRIHDRYIRLGVENANEVRHELGKHPRKGGDIFLAPGLVSGKADDINQIFDSYSGMDQPQGGDSGGDDASAKDSPMGRPRQTTDGSPKNKDRSRTPANSNGLRQSNGANQDKGAK